MRKPYDIMTVYNNRCQYDHNMDMLSTTAVKKPTFFICWECKQVYQAGKGIVERVYL